MLSLSLEFLIIFAINIFIFSLGLLTQIASLYLFFIFLLLVFFDILFFLIINLEQKISMYCWFLMWTLGWTSLGYIRVFYLNRPYNNSFIFLSLTLIFLSIFIMTLFYLFFINQRLGLKGFILNIKHLERIKLEKLYLYISIFSYLLILIRIFDAGGLIPFFTTPYFLRSFSIDVEYFYAGSIVFISPTIFMSLVIIFLRSEKFINKFGVFINLLILLTIKTFEGSRGFLLLIIPLLYLVYRLKKIEKKPWLKYFIIVALLILLLVPFLIYMGSWRNREDINSASITIVDSLFSDLTFDTIDNYLVILQEYSSSDYLWGETLIGPLVTFVPRNIWESKPTGLGRIFVEDHYGGAPGFSVGIYFLGEFFANFGFLGLIFIPPLISLVIYAYDYYFKVSKNITSKVLLIVIFNSTLNIVRGDFMSAGSTVVYFYLFYFILLRIINFFVTSFFSIEKNGSMPKNVDGKQEI